MTVNVQAIIGSRHKWGALALEAVEAAGIRLKLEPLILPFKSFDPKEPGDVDAIRIGETLFCSRRLYDHLHRERFTRKARRWFRWVARADEAVERALRHLSKGTR